MTKKQQQVVENSLTRHNNLLGKGMVAAIVWGIHYAGIDQTYNGLVIRQMQYGMDARAFKVARDTGKIRFLGRSIKVLDE